MSAPTVIPMDAADLDRIPPADLDTCETCEGYGSVLPNPRDPSGVQDCAKCGGTGERGAA